MSDKQEIVVAYHPKILRNMLEICEEMGVGPYTVKRWQKQGAPIVVEGDYSRTRYSAEVASLMAWRLAKTCAERA